MVSSCGTVVVSVCLQDDEFLERRAVRLIFFMIRIHQSQRKKVNSGLGLNQQESATEKGQDDLLNVSLLVYKRYRLRVST